MFRLAFGNCSCREGKAQHPVARAVCDSLLERLALLEEQAKRERNAIPSEWIETQSIGAFEVEFAVVRRELGSDGTLVVVRAFVPTWRFPNYLGIGGVGHLRADGFILTADGTTRAAPPELLWDFR